MDTPNFKSGVVGYGGPQNFSELVNIFVDLARTALPVIVGLAFLVFLWGLAKFIFRIGGDEKALGEGKNLMKWGLIALFVLVSFWSILSFIRGDLGLSQPSNAPFLPVN